MRILIAGFNLESVTFLPNPTTLDEFERVAKRGEDLLSSFENTNTVPGGFIKACKDEGVELVPLVYSEVGAAASATDEAFDHFVDEISRGIRAELYNLDAVLLGLHGALVTENGRTDLDFVSEIRKQIGDDLPLGVAFDLHGNLDPEFTDFTEVLSAYRESPHIDMGDTGERVGKIMIAKLRGEFDPKTVIHKVPITLPSIFTATKVAPLREVMAEARKQEELYANILDCSVVMGFAYADVPQIGISLIVTSKNDPDASKKVIQHMSKLIWNMRESLYPKDSVFNVKNGLRKALEIKKNNKKPAVILEHADRMNDSTYVLQELVKTSNAQVAVPYFWDPQAAKTAHAAGVSSNILLEVGGKSSSKAGQTLVIEVEVIWTGKPKFQMGGLMGKGRPVDLGVTAIVKVKNIFIWLISANISAINLDPFEQFGMDHLDFDLVLLRSKTHFRAVWEKESCGIVIIDTPDWGPALLNTLSYEHARKGVFPIT